MHPARLSWLRRTFSWSTSTESRQERRLVWLLLLAAALLGFLSWCGGVIVQLETGPIRIPRALVNAGWIAWALAAILLVSFGRIKLLGPVLFYDMIRSARRTRYFLLRGFYCSLLLLILFFVWMTTTLQLGDPQEMASRLASTFFEWFTVTQLIAVLVLTPAYVAGAVSEEKDRKTLEFLLATDLRNREIILSKYLARLANLMLFLLTGLPILSVLQFLGGIDPNLVLASFAFTVVTMIGLGGLSMFNSVIYKRPRDSIAITYLFIIGYLGLSTALVQYQPPAILVRGAAPANWGEQIVEFIYAGNIFVLLAKVYEAGARGALATALTGLFIEYALFYGGIGILCLIWATLRLRAIALKQAFGKVSRTLRSRTRPPVTELPMLWKELHVEGSLRLNWPARILLILMLLATFANPFIHFVEFTVGWYGWWNIHRNLGHEVNVWVRVAGTAVACLTILGVAVRAANSIGVERERETIDGLLTTRLGSTEILAAKFLGAMCSVRLGWVWLGLIYVIALLMGGLHLFALPLVVAAWFVFASAAALIGLWYSMASRSSMRATVLTLVTCAGVGVGHWLVWLCCGPLLFLTGGAAGEGSFYFLKFQLGITPPAVLGFLAFHGEEFASEFGTREYTEFLAFCLFGLFLWTLAGVLFWQVLVQRFRTVTGRDDSISPDSPASPSGQLRPHRPEAGAEAADIHTLTPEA